MKLLKIHSEKSVLYFNPEKIVLIATVATSNGFQTGICTGYKSNGDMILMMIDETQEQILEMLNDC